MSTYTYGERFDNDDFETSEQDDRENLPLNVGWLGSSLHFEAAESLDEVFIEALARRCEHPIRQTKGYHLCELCPIDARIASTVVRVADREVSVGSAEIRVRSGGRVFAAPTMILHYVLAHGYAPPDEFVAAVKDL